MTKTISTFFFVGHLPTAPGTWGSIAALPFAYGLHAMGGFPLLLLATALIFFLGWWATSRETIGATNHDPGEIVIDEVVGQWITLLPVSAALSSGWAPSAQLPILILVLGFALFRIFDIKKPSIVGTADRMNTPLGVMLDDVVAGAMAAAALIAILSIYSLFV